MVGLTPLCHLGIILLKQSIYFKQNVWQLKQGAPMCSLLKESSCGYSCCDGSVFFSLVIDHPDPGALKHALHLLWRGRGGKVHILGPLPRQQVTHSTPSYPQLMLVLHKQLWEDKRTGVKQQINKQAARPDHVTPACFSPANPLSPSVNRDWNSLVFSCIVKSLLQRKFDREVKCEFNNFLHICKNSKSASPLAPVKLTGYSNHAGDLLAQLTASGQH